MSGISGLSSLSGLSAICRGIAAAVALQVEDLFERANGGLGADWSANANLAINTGDVGLVAVGGGLTYWLGQGTGAWNADQWAEVVIGSVDPDLIRGQGPIVCLVPATGVRYQLHYNGDDSNASDLGEYALKYDGVPTAETVTWGSGEELLVPNADITTAGWTRQAGGVIDATTPGYAEIDEAVADDTNYLASPMNTTGAVYECAVQAGVDPLRSGRHRITYRIAKVGSGSGTMDVSLVEGTTVRATWAETPAGIATIIRTLTATEADSIIDYTNLRLRFTSTTGANTQNRIYQANVSLPDVAPIDGDVLRIERQGTSLRAYKNSSLILGPVEHATLVGGEIGAIIALAGSPASVPAGAERCIKAWRGGNL